MTRAASSANRDIIKWNENASENYVPKSLCEKTGSRVEAKNVSLANECDAINYEGNESRISKSSLFCAIKPTHALRQPIKWNGTEFNGFTKSAKRRDDEKMAFRSRWVAREKSLLINKTEEKFMVVTLRNDFAVPVIRRHSSFGSEAERKKNYFDIKEFKAVAQ